MILTETNIDKVTKQIHRLNKPIETYNKEVLNFLEDLQKQLMLENKEKLPGISALSFWLRKHNIDRSENLNLPNKLRIGLGIALHITPSNMPLSYFYSYVFGLLSGNVNVVKIPKKNFIENNKLMLIFNKLINKKKYKIIKEKTFFFKFNHEKKIMSELSKICNLRIIWGGDKTITRIREYEIQSHTRELTFGDKYSCCIIDSDQLAKLRKLDFLKLCNAFFSDGYLVDQNACSSPHLVLWIGKNQNIKKKFWIEINNIAKLKYDLPEIGSIEKHLKLYSDIIDQNINNFLVLSHLYAVNIKKINNEVISFRGKWGYFYQYNLKNLHSISKIVNKKFQTITCMGVKKDDVVNVIKNNNLLGVDRVTKIGNAHTMNFYWDGYDLISNMSRIINYE